MGFLDRSKKKAPKGFSERELPLKYEFECCGTAQTFEAQLVIVEDAHNLYLSLRRSDAGEPSLAKFPVASIKVNQQDVATLESVGDSVKEMSSGLSKEKFREVIMGAQCSKCGAASRFIIAQAIVTDEQGRVVLSERPDGSSEVPFAILKYHEEEHSLRLDSLL
jgi:hypothetical protein